VTIIFGGHSVLLSLFRAQKNGIIKTTVDNRNNRKYPILSLKKGKKNFLPNKKGLLRHFGPKCKS
jgi:hypothetical protein